MSSHIPHEVQRLAREQADLRRLTAPYESIAALTRRIPMPTALDRLVEEEARRQRMVDAAVGGPLMRALRDSPAFQFQRLVDSPMERVARDANSWLNRGAIAIEAIRVRDEAVQRLTETQRGIHAALTPFRESMGLRSATMSALDLLALEQAETCRRISECFAPYREIQAALDTFRNALRPYHLMEGAADRLLAAVANRTAASFDDALIIPAIVAPSAAGLALLVAAEPEEVDREDVEASLDQSRRALVGIDSHLAKIHPEIVTAIAGAREALADRHARTTKVSGCVRRAIELALNEVSSIPVVAEERRGEPSAFRKDGAPTRLARIEYALRVAGTTDRSIKKFLHSGIGTCDALIDLLNGPCHTSTAEYDDLTLELIVRQAEAVLLAMAHATRRDADARRLS